MSPQFEGYVIFGDDQKVPLDTIYRLKYSKVAVLNMDKVHNWQQQDVKVVLNFNRYPYQKYWCEFECGNKSLTLIGSKQIPFAGFSYCMYDGRVQRFRIAEGQSGDPALLVSVYSAVRRMSCDTVDGVCSIQEREEKSAETYGVNRDYERGDLIDHLYILFHSAK